MVKDLHEIEDESKSLKDEVDKTLKVNRNAKTTPGEIANWVTRTLELQADLAKKTDELVERLVRLEDEVRKSRFRPEAVPSVPTVNKKK
ncbi:MAG: hypothetical protein NTY99_00765 [DPANN group archaeon]|nr:hypothetical protein [DPANN group archaeon]